ncbi:MAG: hypothetical protein L0216_06500 [Planctomycetales bacterium]|nr:hypothetical protein [Planctomycetales bacterium]
MGNALHVAGWLGLLLVFGFAALFGPLFLWGAVVAPRDPFDWGDVATGLIGTVIGWGIALLSYRNVWDLIRPGRMNQGTIRLKERGVYDPENPQPDSILLASGERLEVPRRAFDGLEVGDHVRVRHSRRYRTVRRIEVLAR